MFNSEKVENRIRQNQLHLHVNVNLLHTNIALTLATKSLIEFVNLNVLIINCKFINDALTHNLTNKQHCSFHNIHLLTLRRGRFRLHYQILL